MIEGKLVPENFHFERLFSGMHCLMMKLSPGLEAEKLKKEIPDLLKNKCERLAGVRLSVYRGIGGLYDEEKKPEYVIECHPLTLSVHKLNTEGFEIDIYPDAGKSCDKI